MNGAGLEIEARGLVDLAGKRVDPGGADFRVGRQTGLVEVLHHVAKHGALRAARRLDALLELFLVVRLALRAHDDDADVVLVVDRGDLVVGAEHVLVQEIANGEQVRMIPDRHHRDDLAGVEEQGQRALGDDSGLDRVAVLVEAGNGLGKARVVRVGRQVEFAHVVLAPGQPGEADVPHFPALHT